MILDKINYPKDLKNLNEKELPLLSDEIRRLIIKKVNTTGGHMGPNLGITEAIIALHYVFNAPFDKIVLDVSHQCYPHKILTGRKEGFLNPDKYDFYTGYTAPEESEYDIFKVGHTSTSISLSLGLAKARDLKNEKYNVIALIGDGSLSGGEALEGLDNAACSKSNIIILVNDNEMSIAENHGGLYKNLEELRKTNGKSQNNFFKTLGFEYLYVEEGNNVSKLIEAFESVKDTQKPVVVHIHTLKGKGLKLAEENKEAFHWIVPGGIESFGQNIEEAESYASITKDFILNKKSDPALAVVTAATPGVFGFNKEFREKLGDKYTDVGIAEEHAAGFSSGLAKGGAKPIFAVMSSFVQRTYDQMSQDIALNNSPMTMLVYWGGISGADATHLCSFDISLIGNIPNIVYLAPTCMEEYIKMLEYSYEQDQKPIAIRVPSNALIKRGIKDNTDYSILNKFKVEIEGKDVAIIAAGSMYPLGLEIQKETNATLINPRFISGIDTDLLDKIKEEYKLIITLEDGIIEGGFGQKISSYLANSSIKVLNYGAKKEFTDRIPSNELYRRYRLKKELAVEDITKILNSTQCAV